MKPQRSLRLEKRSAKSLDTLSGASGEIFYDVDSATLRIYTNNANEKVVLATRSWTTTEIENNAFSGLYADLIGAPTALSSFTNNVGYITLADLPPAETGGAVNINDLLDVEIDTPALGQLLEYDGAKWINTTVAGLTDTNTTYGLDLTSTTNGVDLDLVDSNAVSDIITILGGTGITVSITNTNEVTIDNTGAAPAMNDISDVTVALPEDGHVLQYNSGLWINTAPTGGIALTDFSVSTGAASGSGSLSYDNVNGVFTFTPPDVSAAGIALTDLSILTSTANAGGSLTYNNTTGEFTFRPADLSGISADLVNDTTPQLGGDLELNTNDIVGSGNIDITGAGTFTDTVSAPEFINTGVGAPVITSASTITLTAPDGVTFADSLGNVVIAEGSIRLETTTPQIEFSETLNGLDIKHRVVATDDALWIQADAAGTGPGTYNGTLYLTGLQGDDLTNLNVRATNSTFNGTVDISDGSGQPLTIKQYDNIVSTYGGIVPGNRASITRYNAGDGINIIASDTVNIAGGSNAQVLSNGAITLSAPDGINTRGLVLSGITSPNSGTVNQQVMNCDCTNDTLFIFVNNTFGADYSVNFTNVPSLSEQFFRATVLDFSATGFGPTEVRINGTAITSVYPGGTGGVTFTGPNKTEFIIYSSGGTYIAFGTVTENYST